jgi:putative DNA primase/helicase
VVKPVSPAGGEVVSLLDAEGRTDTNNAARLVRRFGDVLRWVGIWDKWLRWTGKHWRLDRALTTDRRAKDIARSLLATLGGPNAFTELDAKRQHAVLHFIRYSMSRGGVRNMVELAKCDLAIEQDELDRDPWLLNVQNGTLDLRTGKLRAHRKEDFITKLAPVVYDPRAVCPVWDGFIRSTFARNLELIAYVRRLVGHCITGITTEHLLPFLFGTGANGKSTLVETLIALLGTDYAMKAPPDLLLAKRGESHPTDRADLFGKRLVACVETEEGRQLAEALAKELTGGDRIRARRMREDFWEFEATHHVWIAGNYKPAITGRDEGIWRRVKLIPFDVKFLDEKDPLLKGHPELVQDKLLKDKLKGERSGILNWALAGCLEWQRDGMQEPAIVRARTRDYADEMDEVQQFMDDNCDLGAGLTAGAGELFQAFMRMYPETDLTQTSFGNRLRAKGFQNKDEEGKDIRTRTGRHAWRGLKLKISESQAEFLEKWNDRKSKQNG